MTGPLYIDTLSPTRAKDRLAIADILRETAEAGCAEVVVTPSWPDTGCSETYVRVSMAGVSVGIAIGSCEAKNGYVLPWHVDLGATVRLSPAFGRAAGGEVNRFHHRKCTVVCGNLRTARRRLELALQCIADGEAFLTEED